MTEMDDASAAKGAKIGAPVPDPLDGWDAYHHHRSVRGFSAVTGEVKLEPGVEDGGEDVAKSPIRTANGAGLRGRLQSTATPTGSDAPKASTSASASERAASLGQSRKRRGEDQLLLDDHLLPAEMRRTGSSTRKRKGGRMTKDDEEERQDAELVDMEKPERQDASQGDVMEDDEDETVQDVTRCICRRDGESVSASAVSLTASQIRTR